MRQLSRVRRLVSVAIVAALICAIWSSSPGLARSAKTPTLRLNYGVPFGNIDPAHIGGTGDVDMSLLFNQGLIQIGTNDKVMPGLANKWNISKNGKVYTFFIRKNARFSNGHHVTAQDVVYTLRRNLAPSAHTFLGYYDALIKGYTRYNTGKSSFLGVKALNARTVQITISKRAAYFLMAFTASINEVMDPSLSRGKNAGPDNNYLNNTCSANQGAGPFKLVCRNKSSSGIGSFYPPNQTPRITLVANPYYWGPKPHIKLVLMGGTSQYDQYLSNAIDTAVVPLDFINTWIKNPRGQFHRANTSIIDYITVGTKSPPFNNVNCRLAAAWALNRNAIAKIDHHTVSPLYTILPKHFLGWWNGAGVPHYNLAKAHQYLNKCPGKSMPVVYKYQISTTSNAPNDEALAIVNMLDQAGFKATGDAVTSADWGKVATLPFTQSNTQLARNGWAQDYPDPQDYTTLILRCGAVYDIGQFCNKKFDNLVDRADVERNQSVRGKLYIQAQKVALNNGALLMFDNRTESALIKPWVHGLVLTIAYADLMPKNMDWSKVSISKH